MATDIAAHDSDSDLSDVHEPLIVHASPSASESPDQQADYENNDPEASDSSEPDNQDGSDDGGSDIDDETVAPRTHGQRIDRSSSQDSRRPTKRKAPLDEDEHIMANPELYGLRRSVRFILH